VLKTCSESCAAHCPLSQPTARQLHASTREKVLILKVRSQVMLRFDERLFFAVSCTRSLPDCIQHNTLWISHYDGHRKSITISWETNKKKCRYCDPWEIWLFTSDIGNFCPSWSHNTSPLCLWQCLTVFNTSGSIKGYLWRHRYSPGLHGKYHWACHTIALWET
jgi:hypothetical protein